MKNINLQSLLIVTILFASSCGSGQKENQESSTEEIESQEEVAENQNEKLLLGKWRMVYFEVPDLKKKTFGRCDSLTIWEFTSEENNSINKVVSSSASDCKFYDFESKWRFSKYGDLFIESTRIGGMGGTSNAGNFKVIELNETILTLKFFNNVYYFERVM